jgi:hypothetical protein
LVEPAGSPQARAQTAARSDGSEQSWSAPGEDGDEVASPLWVYGYTVLSDDLRRIFQIRLLHVVADDDALARSNHERLKWRRLNTAIVECLGTTVVEVQRS